MPMCPVCGARIWRTPRPNEEIVCSHCKFRLHVKRDVSGTPTNELEIVEQSLSETEAEEKWRKEHPEYYAPSPSEGSAGEKLVKNQTKTSAKAADSSMLKATGIRCKQCNSLIDAPNPKFCPKCGARVVSKAKEVHLMPNVTVKARKRQHPPAPQISKCMVCNIELSRRDDVVLCPHCHSLAHRNHLIEWLRTKSLCPSCGKELNQAYYK